MWDLPPPLPAVLMIAHVGGASKRGIIFTVVRVHLQGKGVGSIWGVPPTVQVSLYMCTQPKHQPLAWQSLTHGLSRIHKAPCMVLRHHMRCLACLPCLLATPMPSYPKGRNLHCLKIQITRRVLSNLGVCWFFTPQWYAHP